MSTVDGLPPGEGAFLACTFWLVDNYTLQGRVDEARALLDRLLSLRNDVGLLAEEYDTVTRAAGRQFPAGVLACAAREHGGDVGVGGRKNGHDEPDREPCAAAMTCSDVRKPLHSFVRGISKIIRGRVVYDSFTPTRPEGTVR